MVLFKTVFMIVLIVLAWMNVEAVVEGRLLAAQYAATGRYNPRKLRIKRRFANRTFWLTILVIGLVEPMSKASSADYGSLFWFHLAFALSAFGLLVCARFFVTGLRHPCWHRWIVWPYIICMLVVIPTGIYMVVRL